MLCLMAFSLSAKEVKFESLGVSIKPPVAFVQAKRFTGFEQLETFTTIKIEELSLPFTKVLAKEMAANKPTVSSESVTISNLEGLLLEQQHTISGQAFAQMTLLFGDELSSIKIVASYPATMNQSMGPIIKTSLLSARMSKLTKARLFKGLPFKLNETGGMAYHMRATNSIVLKNKAPYDPKKTIAPTYIISHSLTDEPVSDIKEFSKQWLTRAQAFEQFEIVDFGQISVAGVPSYKVIAKAKNINSQLPVIFYQVITLQDKRFMLIHAYTSQSLSDKFLPVFENITQNIAFNKAAEQP